jgi:inner membrane protein
MTGRTHDLAAITALLAVVLVQPARTLTLSTLLLCILANQIGGIAPDIDQPTAPLWRNLPIGGFFGKIFGNLLGGHRFLTHSLIGAALFGFLVKLGLAALHPLLPHTDVGLVLWSFLIGMLSHLAMDTLTKEGVPWLLPIPVKFGIPPLKRLRITTGKKLETLVVFPALLGIIIWLVASHYHQILVLLKHHLV